MTLTNPHFRCCPAQVPELPSRSSGISIAFNSKSPEDKDGQVGLVKPNEGPELVQMQQPTILNRVLTLRRRLWTLVQ